jgi:hypothetical protein
MRSNTPPMLAPSGIGWPPAPPSIPTATPAPAAGYAGDTVKKKIRNGLALIGVMTP